MQIEVVGVRFRHGITTYSFSPNGGKYKKGDKVWLHPENRNMNDIFPTELTILGIVVGLIRTKIK